MQTFTAELAHAFIRQEVDCRILEAEYDKPGKFLQDLLRDPPDCTLSFNGLLPDEEGRFLCDMVRIPHVACLIDSPNHFFSLIRSRYTIISCIDKFFCDFFRGFPACHALFLPHGVDKNLSARIKAEKKYQILMPASFIDYEQIAEEWKRKYQPSIRKMLHHAVEIALSDSTISYIQAFVQAMDLQLQISVDIDPNRLNIEELFDDLESYIRGKDRIELVKSIEDRPIHIVGEGNTEENWKKYLGKAAGRLRLQEKIPYQEVVERMKLSKVILSSTPSIKYGAHERIFAGLASGAAVAANGNAYLADIFKEGKGVLLYESSNRAAINEKIDALLSDEFLREAQVEKGREIVFREHTWDARAKTLIKELPPILDGILHS